MKVENLDLSALTDFAYHLGEKLSTGDVLVLTGDLGAGKTTFTKGLGLGLGISQMIKSPTFTIVREYRGGRLPLFHMDVYRIGDDPDSFDMEEYFEAGGVVVIEWGELLGDDKPENYLEICFKVINEKRRSLELLPHGEHYINLVENL